jgi:hypothetical protein
MSPRVILTYTSWTPGLGGQSLDGALDSAFTKAEDINTCDFSMLAGRLA